MVLDAISTDATESRNIQAMHKEEGQGDITNDDPNSTKNLAGINANDFESINNTGMDCERISMFFCVGFPCRLKISLVCGFTTLECNAMSNLC